MGSREDFSLAVRSLAEPDKPKKLSQVYYAQKDSTFGLQPVLKFAAIPSSLVQPIVPQVTSRRLPLPSTKLRAVLTAQEICMHVVQP
jgi:hypothetical protein